MNRIDAKMDDVLALLHQLTSATISPQTASSGPGWGNDHANSASQPSNYCYFFLDCSTFCTEYSFFCYYSCTDQWLFISVLLCSM